jgi:hypothetical protein
MLSTFFGQVDYNYTYTTTDVDTGGFFLFTGAFLFFWLAFVVIVYVAMWKIFVKAGEPGWKALIPIYNYWVLCEIVGRPGWWSLSFLLSIIPFVGWIIPFVVYVIVALDLGKAFKKSTAFSVFGLIIFSIVGMLILGFGSDKFHKADPVKLGDLDPKYTRKDGGTHKASKES